MESIKYIKSGGMIVIEDTHTSYMRDKGFKNPSNNFVVIAGDILHNHERLHTTSLNKAYEFIDKVRSVSKT